MLDNNGICASDVESEGTVGVVDAKTHAEHEDFGEMPDTDGDGQAVLYNALLQAATLGQSTIAIGLLQASADPNYGLHGRRLGKVKGGRIEQKSVFRSSPMHLACLKGDDTLVRKLLEKNSNFKSPDASGLYPLHLASSGIDDEESGTNEDLRRLECVKLLLEAGAPLAMRDGNKQSILHSAARAGHCRLLTYAMSLWKERNSHQPPSKHFFNWRDRWLRTPVHWAVLNGRVDALRILLEMGSSPCPPKPSVNKRSSAAVESPLEMCDRLYGKAATGKGAEIRRLLTTTNGEYQ